MLDTQAFGTLLTMHRIRWATGVPCSYLENLINYSSNHLRYVAATNEGDAVALAAGAWIAGVGTAVLMQNSGLANAVSPLTSLTHTFKIPLLGFVSLRGEPGIPDEPQHELTGKITTRMLDVMEIPWRYLSDNAAESQEQFHYADDVLTSGRSFFFVVRKDTFSRELLFSAERTVQKNVIVSLKRESDQRPSRYDVLRVINSGKNGHTVQIVTTGKAGRELFTIEDAPNNFYMVGSMGCASSFGLGIALARPDRKVVVIDGDGALLMRMGSLAMNGYYGGANFLHVLLDNESYESTGGQQSIAHNVDFVTLAAACGYSQSLYVHSLAELDAAIAAWQVSPCLSFFHIKVSGASRDNLGRPTVSPYEVQQRLKRFIENGAG
jgi:phosphonopyruvate decarboxylase